MIIDNMTDIMQLCITHLLGETSHAGKNVGK